MTETLHTEGREIRAAEVDFPDVGDFSNAIEDIYEDRLDALVLRGGMPVDVATSVTRRLTENADLPWLRPNKIGPRADIHVLGVAATPTFETPGGPDVE